MPEALALRVYRVTVKPDGERFDCAAGQSILDAAHAANILVAYSCRSGQCGSCRGRVIDGNVGYPRGLPDALDANEAEQGYALFCSAFAESDLVIELLRPEFPP